MDLDGSTLADKNVLPTELRALIQQHPQINWIITTGRSYPNFIRAPFKGLLPDDSLHIIEGGARIVQLDGTLLNEFGIQATELQHLFSIIDLSAIDYMYFCSPLLHGNAWYRHNDVIDKFNLPASNYTFNFEEFKAMAYELNPGKVSLYRNQEFELVGLNYHSTGNNIDITTAQINKGSGCNLLLERLNIDASHALFIFNDFNDLPLINAVPEIKKLKVGTLMPEISADYYAATPDDVAAVLRQLL